MANTCGGADDGPFHRMYTRFTRMSPLAASPGGVFEAPFGIDALDEDLERRLEAEAERMIDDRKP